MTPKITVLFQSTYGTNHGIGVEAARAAEAAGGEVRLRRCSETAPESVVNEQKAWREQIEKMKDIPEATPEDMEWADGYFISVHTRFGVPSSQFRTFVDTLRRLWQNGDLANKAITATTSAQNPKGGQEMTIQSIYTTAMHWGAIIVPPGYADPIRFEDGGNPYGNSCTIGALSDTGKKSVVFKSERLVNFARKIMD